MEYWFLLSVDMHHVVLCCVVLNCVQSHWILQEANQYSDRTELRSEELHAAFNSLLKCFSHARDHAVSVTQTCRPATITLAATCCLGLLLWSWLPVGLGARGVGPPVLVSVRGLDRPDWRLVLGNGSPTGSATGHALAVLLHQWDQALRWATLQQEGVLQQVSGAGPF